MDIIQYDKGDELTQTFESYASKVKLLKQRPFDGELLLLYGLYKQARDGRYRESQKPGPFDAKGLAKWNAWRANRGKTKTQAMQEYISMVEMLIKKYGLK